MLPSKSIVLRFSDGLGNQMFQYAFARMQSKLSGLPLFYDLAWYRSGPGLGRPDRPFWMDHYKINAHALNENEASALCPSNMWVNGRLSSCRWLVEPLLGKRLIIESANDVVKRCSSYHSNWLDAKKGAFISGYFASYHYPEAVRQELLTELQTQEPMPEDVCEHIANLQSHDSAAVCFRRGDYKIIPHLGVMGDSYYARAFEIIRQRVPGARFYIFSDEPEEAYRLLAKHGAEIVDWANAERPVPQKLAILQACRHYMLANSTFGWWAAWLGRQKDSVITRPAIWFQGLGRSYDQLFPPDWISVED